MPQTKFKVQIVRDFFSSCSLDQILRNNLLQHPQTGSLYIAQGVTCLKTNLKNLIFQISLFITASILTYLAAIPLCLLVELPFTQLWKTLVDGDKPASPRPRPPQVLPPVEVKPFDLVANVNNHRRHVVRVD